MWLLDGDERAARLLVALRQAGCECFLDDGDPMVSPPLRPVAWDGDPEHAIEQYEDQLRDLLVTAETIH